MVFASFLSITAQTKDTIPSKNHGRNFVDKNGDGYNDNAPDHDGDGIPNGLDPDYKGAKVQRNKFVDLDGDGINDNAGNGNRKVKKGFGSDVGKAIEKQNGSGSGAKRTNSRGFKGGRK